MSHLNKQVDQVQSCSVEKTPEQKIARPRGRPRLLTPKLHTNIRFDADVLAALRARGKGWQKQVNDVIRAWVKL